MKLWQKIYITTLLVFLPVLNIGLFMGARLVFNYNLENVKKQASDEVHLLSHTIVTHVESLDYQQQLSDTIVYEVGATYVNYITNKDESTSMELHMIGESIDMQMGVQRIDIYSDGEYPVLRILELLEAPYETYQLQYFKTLTDFYNLWQTLKLVFAVISFCCSIVLAIVLYQLLFEMTGPLQRLSESVERMRENGKWQPVEVQGEDDIAELTHSFNQMGAEIEAHIRQLQKESNTKQQLVDDLAHEMRTPLTAIYGYAEYLQKAPYTEEEKLDALEYIMSESKRLSNMGQELLRLAVYREDDINMEKLETQELVKNVSAMLSNTLHEKRLRLICDVKKCSFEGDKSMLICLLRNLIENAARASESGSKIWLTVHKTGDRIRFCIRDEGIGMQAHELEHIKDAFYRVDKARSRFNGGAGIGLNLCDLIVTKHNGSMEFESEPGKGTIVTVLLPVTVQGIGQKEAERGERNRK